MAATLLVRAGQSVGFMALGASLHDVLTALKADVKVFPVLEVTYSSSEPLVEPVIVNLPENGVRLRFDGPDQRLRLVEVLDFNKSRLLYKTEDILPHQDTSNSTQSTPLMFRRVYSLFGPSYAGEYLPPTDVADAAAAMGTYILSYPGIALSFPLHPSAYSPKADHAAMLTASAGPVTSMAVFDGLRWHEARRDLFTRKVNQTRSLLPPGRTRDPIPDEIELVKVYLSGKVELVRRTSPLFGITLGETTPQDLITELGPPNAISKRRGQVDDLPQKPARNGVRRTSGPMPRGSLPRGSYGSTPSSFSSSNTDTYEADFEEDDGIDGPDVVHVEEQYYCYFEHGFDLLLGPPTESSGKGQDGHRPPLSESRLTVTRIILHGNVPGSFPFNRYRRSRWALGDVGGVSEEPITSETKFANAHPALLAAYKDVWPDKDMKEGMVIVRSWGGDSPSGSAILVGGEMDEDEEEAWDKNGEQWLKNTRLYKFPGLMFEVMHNGSVSACTVY